MTITTSAAELKFLQCLLQSSLRNLSSMNGSGVIGLAASFAFRSSLKQVRQ